MQAQTCRSCSLLSRSTSANCATRASTPQNTCSADNQRLRGHTERAAAGRCSLAFGSEHFHACHSCRVHSADAPNPTSWPVACYTSGEIGTSRCRQ